MVWNLNPCAVLRSCVRSTLVEFPLRISRFQQKSIVPALVGLTLIKWSRASQYIRILQMAANSNGQNVLYVAAACVDAYSLVDLQWL